MHDESMTALENYVEQAIPHESGHILVGRILGIPVARLDHIVIRSQSNEILPGNFATVGMSPPPDPLAIQMTPIDVIEAYTSYVGGGLAGNMLSGLTADEYGLEKDRSDLKVVSNKTLEEVAKKARLVIEQNLTIFENLRRAFRDSYNSLVKDQNPAAGRYTLLNTGDLDVICPQNKTRFPAFF
jgi:hypothetical protein